MSESYDIETGDANEFSRFFSGNTTHFGIFIPPTDKDIAEGVKLKGDNATYRAPLSIQHYMEHLAGIKGLGIVPIYDEQWVNFSVIDVDSYDNTKTKDILMMIENQGLPLLPFRSKSGGLHLYIFYSEPVKAIDSIHLMKQFLVIFHLNAKTEIFPKQSVLKGNNQGNWINLPYFSMHDTSRYLIKPNDKGPASFYEAMGIIAKNRYTLDQALQCVKSLPLSDGPPCLQHIMSQGKYAEGAGNNFFFSLGRYYKIKDPDSLETELQAANQNLANPINEREMDATIRSVQKSDASYLCQQEPLLSLCNKAVCTAREFGIAHTDISNFSFGQLTVFNSDPPYYIWEVDGAKLEFYNEESLISQRNFQTLCVRHLRKLPKTLKDHAWTKIINNALANVKIETPEKEDDFSTGVVFMKHLVFFLAYRHTAQTKEQVLIGGVWRDDKILKYWFQIDVFYEYLMNQNFRSYPIAEMKERLKRLGAEAGRLFINKDVAQIRAWSIPYSSIASRLTDVAPKVDIESLAEDQIGQF